MDKFQIVLSATGCKPSNSSEIEKDNDGYYKVRLGAFNVFNSMGEFYTSEGVQDLLTNKNSFFYKRLKKGYLLGEMDHPSMKPGMNMSNFMNRIATIDGENVAFHVRDVILTETNERVNVAGNNGNVLLVEGWIKPSGPKGKYLQEALDNPDRNVAFSVRSLSKDVKIQGVTFKKTVAIVNWDWVFEPGISNINKFDMLNNKVVNTESNVQLLSINVEEEAIDDMTTSLVNAGVNQESAEYETVKEIQGMIKSCFTGGSLSKVLAW